MAQSRNPSRALYATGNGDMETTELINPESVQNLDAFVPPSLNSSGDEYRPIRINTSPCNSTDSLVKDTDTDTLLPSETYFSQVLDQPEEMKHNTSSVGVTRRHLFQQSVALLFGGAFIGATTLISSDYIDSATSATTTITSTSRNKVIRPSETTRQKIVAARNAAKRIAPVNFTRVVAETAINVTLDCDKGCVSLDSKNFTKIQVKKVPKWYPAFLIPPPKVIKEISNGELLVAATVAGAATEMFRTTLLYPLQTVKTRIQTDVHNFTAQSPRIEERLTNLRRNVRRHVQEGDLYAGITPSLLISVPASGVYFGVRDVCKRILGMMPFFNDVEIILIAALIADVVSLSFRTPADALALRLQDQNDDVGDWVGDGLKRLPSVIITDLPYLLSKIFLGRQFIHGSLSIDRYAEYAIISAVVAAFLTTPFDVARTRILVDSDGDFSSGKDGGSGEGVLRTMVAITKEGRGGIANLFAGWLERVLYLGIGRAWLEPLQIIAYVGIRDAILLGWF